MEMRKCLCGADAELREQTETRADGGVETFYWVACPICGQLGPRVAAAGRDRETATAEAISAWNAMLARARPLEA